MITDADERDSPPASGRLSVPDKSKSGNGRRDDLRRQRSSTLLRVSGGYILVTDLHCIHWMSENCCVMQRVFDNLFGDVRFLHEGGAHAGD